MTELQNTQTNDAIMFIRPFDEFCSIDGYGSDAKRSPIYFRRSDRSEIEAYEEEVGPIEAGTELITLVIEIEGEDWMDTKIFPVPAGALCWGPGIWRCLIQEAGYRRSDIHYKTLIRLVDEMKCEKEEASTEAAQ